MEEGDVWGTDDDTDIEYIFQEILDGNNLSVATPDNPLFPALRSGPAAGSGASPKKQIPSSKISGAK